MLYAHTPATRHSEPCVRPFPHPFIASSKKHMLKLDTSVAHRPLRTPVTADRKRRSRCPFFHTCWFTNCAPSQRIVQTPSSKGQIDVNRVGSPLVWIRKPLECAREWTICIDSMYGKGTRNYARWVNVNISICIYGSCLENKKLRK